MKRLAMSCLWVAAALALPATVSAEIHGPAMGGNGSTAGKTAPTAYRGAGTVTRVVLELGAVMIAHEPVPELRWPAMNMTFGVRSDAVLQNVEQGDRIDFTFVKSGDNYIITSISSTSERRVP